MCGRVSSFSIFVHSPVIGIGFNPTLYSVEEDSGVVVFVVQNRNPDMEREVTVQFTTIEGTATGTIVALSNIVELPHNIILHNIAACI